MAKFKSARAFEKLGFDIEAFSHLQGGSPVRYFVVTNPERFIAALEPSLRIKWVLEPEEVERKRGKIDHPRKRAERRVETLIRELGRKLNLKGYLTAEQVGQNHLYGYVNLMSIPVVDESAVKGTLLEGQEAIKVFRVMQPSNLRDFKKRFSHLEFQPYQHQTQTITGPDLDTICMHTDERSVGIPALIPIDEVFIDSFEGTNIAGSLHFLREREAAIALSTLRHSAEEVFKTNLKRVCGEAFEDDRERNYIEELKAKKEISTSDFVQATALMFAGNRAVHGEHLTFHSLNAILAYSWLTDYVSRTVGMHRLSRSKVNGTSLGIPYEQELDEEKHALIRAIFDQFQAIKATEPAKLYESQVIAGERTLSKVDAMKNAVELFEYISGSNGFRANGKTIEEQLCDSDKKFCEAMRCWKNRTEKKRYTEYSAEDAVRANLFIFGIWYCTHRQDPKRLKQRSPADLGDNTLYVAIRRKAAGPTFYDESFKPLEAKLHASLTIAKDISESYLQTLSGIQLR